MTKFLFQQFMESESMNSSVEKVRNCIETYNIREIKSDVEAALNAGVSATMILNDGMISAMTDIGNRFKENKIFMPQMLVAAKTMQSGLEVLKPHLMSGGDSAYKGKAVVGSVEGDVHDIGKNLVCIMLEGVGMEVRDLGVDVPDSAFLGALNDDPEIQFVACSSTMTPTREALRTVVHGIRGGDRSDAVVLVGGATMDQAFCNEIGADIYTADAASAADRVRDIASGRPIDEVKAESERIATELSVPAVAEEVDTVQTEALTNRHSMEAPIRAAGRGEQDALSIKDNFIETLKHEGGCPDRYVNQYEFFDIIFDPILSNSMGLGRGSPGVEFQDGWGCTSVAPVGSGGPHPVHGPGKTVISDITRWEEYLKPAQLEFAESEWEKTKPLMEAADESGKFRGIWMSIGLFERVHYLLGMQEALVEYYQHPDEMHALIDALTDWEIASLDRTMERIEAPVLFHHDDWGTALNSFLDPDTHRAFFEEPYKRIYSHFRELGGEYVVHHCDCYAANLVPVMIDVGIDVWQGPTDNNNIPDLIDRYGDKIIFMGGIDDGAVDVSDWTPASVSGYVTKKCDQNGVVSYIPCLTRGRGRSIYPGVYDEISKTIGELSKRKF